MRWFGLAGAMAWGCSGGGDATCTPLASGEWTINGSAMGMPMGATVTMDADKCEFAFSDWSMEMLSLPIGGSIDGTALTLDGDAHWSSCTGTVDAEGTGASGTCSDDGTEFALAMGELDTGM